MESEEKYPVRLDLKTRLCLMASIIYGLSELSEEDAVAAAVKAAVEIENASDAQVKRMKQENPVPRKGTRNVSQSVRSQKDAG